MKSLLLFSHGFGVQKDDRGIFTDVAERFPSFDKVLFDYNLIDVASNTLTVRPIDEQVSLLEEQYARINNDAQKIYLICHSQGCLVAALANLPRIHKAVFITPAQTINVDAFLKKFDGRPNTKIDRQGISTFGRKDGSTTVVPKSYLDSIERLDLATAYKSFCMKIPTLIISARQDEVLKGTDFRYLSDSAIVETLDGDHNFSDDSQRSAMLSRIVRFID